jgi:hypothetical protein
MVVRVHLDTTWVFTDHNKRERGGGGGGFGGRKRGVKNQTAETKDDMLGK